MTVELLRDSHGELLRARTYSATAIHTPKPESPRRTFCGGTVMLFSEWDCESSPCGYPEDHNENGKHEADLTVCAGDDPQLCKRCEASIIKRLAR